MLSSRHRPLLHRRQKYTLVDGSAQQARTCMAGRSIIGIEHQLKRTGTWRRMNMLRFSLSKTLNSVMISQM